MAPSPIEPSRKLCGTALIMSSDKEEIKGIIIIPIIAPAAKADSDETSKPSEKPISRKNGAAVNAAKYP